MEDRLPLNLLDLPIDILALILTPLVKFDTAVELCPCPHHGTLDEQLNIARSVLLVHPQLHAIACPMLYNLNTFKLSITSGAHGISQTRMLQSYAHTDSSGRACDVPAVLGNQTDAPGSLAAEQREQMGKLQLFVTPSARRRIRNLMLEVGRHRGWIDQAVTPVLSDMILAGNLTSLSITLLYQSHEANLRNRLAMGNPHASASSLGVDPVILTKPPLKGFFQVLADPDLETSQLFITRGHPSAWCKYHTQEGPYDDRKPDCPYKAAVDWLSVVREVLDPDGVSIAAPWSKAATRLARNEG
ncbi:hypothetical protein NLG97_g7591 [Lecanicillium saksenae]|uniref:Uncharacterized protein n=1 Tax=Lecanicillium saksenae TaxID=468837 RepID=A0ACC1QMH3_9HYPO|nr:hypothetical protein NLG97_g7591 [Lecanicillium saksenae]